MLGRFKHTVFCSYTGYFVQAIINNFAPLLFLTFRSTFGFSYRQLSVLILFNFLFQLCVDALSAVVIHKLGYRRCLVAAHILAAVGLVSLGHLPYLLPNAFFGVILSIFLYAVGSGLIEVIVSPLVEACPTKNKAASMSLLHSFYCWGQVSVVLLSTVFFSTVGIAHWRLLSNLWAIIPLCNAVYACVVPIPTVLDEAPGDPVRVLFRKPTFLLCALVMLCAGASELAMSQWASAFAESGLGVSKMTGDLLGPCAFAVLMGVARVFYAAISKKVPLPVALGASASLCAVCYVVSSLSPWPLLSLLSCAVCGFSVGILWPGTFSLAAKEIPTGGTRLFALLALFGDFGCAAGPFVVGQVTSLFGDRLQTGLLVGTLFPLVLAVAMLLQKLRRKSAGSALA